MFIRIMYALTVVTDQDKALAFYAKLGFEKQIDYPGPEGRFLTVALENQEVELILWKGDPTSFTGNPETPVSANPGMIFIESSDLKADFDALTLQNVKFVENAPENYPWGIRITAIDPDGNRIALRQRKRD